MQQLERRERAELLHTRFKLKEAQGQLSARDEQLKAAKKETDALRQDFEAAATERECGRAEIEKLQDEVAVRLQEFRNLETRYHKVLDSKRLEFNLQLRSLEEEVENVAPRAVSPGLRTLSAKIAPTSCKRPAKRKTPKKCSACHFEISKYVNMGSDQLLQLTLAQAREMESKLGRRQQQKEPVRERSEEEAPQPGPGKLAARVRALEGQVESGARSYAALSEARDELERRVNEACCSEAALERKFKLLLGQFQQFADEAASEQAESERLQHALKHTAPLRRALSRSQLDPPDLEAELAQKTEELAATQKRLTELEHERREQSTLSRAEDTLEVYRRMVEELENEKAEVREEGHRRLAELQDRLRAKDSELNQLRGQVRVAPTSPHGPPPPAPPAQPGRDY